MGRDSLLLGEFTTVRQGGRVYDLGCGSGVLLLLLAQRAERLTLDGVELDLAAAELAGETWQTTACGGRSRRET